MDYSFIGQGPDSGISVGSSPTAGATMPMIGPEIGPDPRNAVALVRLPDEPSMDAGNGVRYDFANGFRVQAPAAPGDYEIVVWNRDTGIELFRSAMSPGSLAVGSRKYFIRYRIELSDRSSGRLLAHVDYDCTDKDVLVSVPDGGLGDNIAWLPYAEQFRVTHKARVTCACGEWLIRLVKDQYPELRFVPISETPDSSRYYAVYYCAVFGQDRLDWRPLTHQHFGMQGTVAGILGVPFEPLKTRFRLDAPRTIAESYVVISAMASNPCKHWNWPDGWNLLCRYLKRLGYRVFVIDRDRELDFGGVRCAVPDEAEDMTGARPIAERIALLQHADFFVGLPSGLSWLAWCCNIPVVMISGFTEDGSEFPTPYRVFNPNFCHGCWNDTDCFFDTKVAVWCPHHAGTPREIECTRVITPKMVIDTVNRIPAVQARLAARPPVRISVIIAVFRGNYLVPCVRSVVEAFSSYGRTEILLYNDASPEPGLDGLLQMLQAENPDMIRLFRGEANVGVAEARQEMLRHVRGDYIVSFDHDDVMLPFDVKKVVDFMDANPQYAASYAPKYLFNEKGYMNVIHGSEFSHLQSFFAPKVNINAAFLRRTDLMEVGGFLRVRGDKTSPLDDVYLYIRLFQGKDVHFDPEARALYRMHATQISHNNQSWDDWITQQPCDEHPELVKRILAGDIPDPCGSDFRIVRGLMGAMIFFHQNEPKITEPIIQAAMRYFPDDPGVPDARLRLFRLEGRIEELLAYYPKALEQFKHAIFPRITILGHVLSAMQTAGLLLPQELVRQYEELSRAYFKLSPAAEAMLRRLGLPVSERQSGEVASHG